MDTAYPQTKFGITALRAADLASRGVAPADAWRSTTLSIFPDSLANQAKGCPRSAFLGLAEAGHIDGILPGKYTTSVDNKRYALDALRLLKANPALADKPDELWQRVLNGDHKRHNSQMNVVIALWKARKFVCQNNSK